MDQPEEDEFPEGAYFPVSPTKLVVMSICTVGIYHICWAWRCWEYIKFRDDRRFNPFWRSVYVSHLFFNFLLCWDVFRHTGHSKLKSLAWSSGLGLAYVLSWFCGMAAETGGLWAIALLGFFVFVPVQLQINKFNEAEHPGHDPNRKFSRANIVAAVVGGLVIGLTLVGSYLPPE